MKKDLHERLKACIGIELGVANIYRTFSEKLPEAKDLWYDLSLEEENHAAILVLGGKYNEMGVLPDNIVPSSMHGIKQTVDLVKETEKRAQSESLSLKAALDMSLKLEKTKEESYLPEILAKETDSEVISRLQQLLNDTKLHILRLSDYRKQKGFK